MNDLLLTEKSITPLREGEMFLYLGLSGVKMEGECDKPPSICQPFSF
jgi:hypothetical protein